MIETMRRYWSKWWCARLGSNQKRALLQTPPEATRSHSNLGSVRSSCGPQRFTFNKPAPLRAFLEMAEIRQGGPVLAQTAVVMLAFLATSAMASERPGSLYQAAAEAGLRVDAFPTPSPEPTPFREFRGAFWTDVGFAVVGNGLDLASTEWRLDRCPTCRETFPLGDTRGRRIAIKALSVSARAWTSYRLRRSGHKGAATAVRFVWFAVDVGVAAHNMRLGKR